jgi:hypothetical protein
MMSDSMKKKQSLVDNPRIHFGQINLGIVLHCNVGSSQFLVHMDCKQILLVPPA